jgi:hypothetical protein
VAQAQRSEDRNPGGGLQRGSADAGLRWRPAEGWTLEAGWRARRETVGTQGNGLSSLPFGSTAGPRQVRQRRSAGLRQPGAGPGHRRAGDPGQHAADAVNPLPAGTRLSADTVRLGLGWRVAERLTLGGEVEHEVDGDDRRRVAVGADWRLTDWARLYARWEQQQRLDHLHGVSANDSRASALVFGIDGQPLPTRRPSANTGCATPSAATTSSWPRACAGNGRWPKAWACKRGWNASRCCAATVPPPPRPRWGWTGPRSELWRGATRLEVRRSADLGTTDTVDERFTTTLWTGLLARKIDRDWTALARHHLLRTDYRARGDVLQNRTQLGLAWRDTDTNRGNALAKLEWKHESDASNADTGTLKTRALVASTAGRMAPVAALVAVGPRGGQVAEGPLRRRHRCPTSAPSGCRAGWSTTSTSAGTSAWPLPCSAARAARGRRPYGLEVGYLLATNLWLSAGFNRSGFDADRDLSGYEYTQRGAYLRLRFKFDETLFQGSDPAVNRSLPR